MCEKQQFVLLWIPIYIPLHDKSSKGRRSKGEVESQKVKSLKSKIEGPKFQVKGPILGSNSKDPINERLVLKSRKKARRAGV